MAWAEPKAVNVYALRSRRLQRLRFPRFDRRASSHPIGLSGTEARLLIAVPRPEVPDALSRARLIQLRFPDRFREA